MNTTVQDVYGSTDLVEITFLLTRGRRICGIVRDPQTGTVTFWFEGATDCRELAMDLAAGDDQVSLTAAIDKLKRVRAMMTRA